MGWGRGDTRGGEGEGGVGGGGADLGFLMGGTFPEDPHFSARVLFWYFFRREGPLFSKRALFRYFFDEKADFWPLSALL